MVQIIDGEVARQEGSVQELQSLYSVCVQAEKWFEHKCGDGGWVANVGSQIAKKRQHEAEAALTVAISKLLNDADAATVEDLGKARSAVQEFLAVEATTSNEKLLSMLQETPNDILAILENIIKDPTAPLPSNDYVAGMQNLFHSLEVTHA